MLAKLFSVLIIIFIFSSCSKNEAVYIPSEKKEPYKIYSEALEAFEKNDFFNASKKFAEAELNFENGFSCKIFNHE